MSSEAESAVQQELQDYLSEKGVNTLFIKIVEQLLLEKPDSPIAFIVEYLLKNFPEDTSEFCKVADVEKNTARSNNESVNATLGQEEDTDDDDDDENDYVEELPAFKSTTAVSRRTSVSAGVLALNVSVDKILFEKSKQDASRLNDILMENVLCSHLDDEDRKTIVDAFESIEVDAEAEIITQGDTVAEHFYILDSGTAHVFKNGEKLSVEYGPGDSFGELALMYNAPRAATVKAYENCKLWRLDQITFKTSLMSSATKKREKYVEFLKQVPILSEMAEQERMTLADAMKEKTYNEADIIVQEGDPGDEFFIISSGEVSVQKDEKEISTLSEGKYFGEIALLTTKNRQATVIAKTPQVKVLAVHRKVFQRVLGPLSDILSRNMESYSNWLTT